ncbi:hypothetical protein B0A49_10315 [Cryomyces minteri]|uniref:Uncharacterized protein n=1 Tax=Cryomyces minteri TaxID=331657 RepID=A0A4U0W079_9PEZI|nr:hypothetical protein B0A49_10315 [Cryomyces minteri]
METAHRRIELQSPADLSYLVANASRAARQKIDLHLPPSAAPQGEDALRRRVEEPVEQQYIRATFALAKPSLSINGMDPAAELLSAAQKGEGAVAGEEEEYEPHDARLTARIATLTATHESLTASLATLRRTAPAAAAAALRAGLAADATAWAAGLASSRERALHEARTAAPALHVGPLERWDEVASSWARGTEGLVRARAEITGTVATVERAATAAAYVEAGDGPR